MTQEPLVLTLERPEWDLASRDDLVAMLEPAHAHSNVILDMTNVTYIDSSCLSELMVMRRKRGELGYGPALLVVPSAQIRRVLSLVGFDQIWPLYQNLEAALTDANANAPTGSSTTVA